MRPVLDGYTKVVLTVIAACLVKLALVQSAAAQPGQPGDELTRLCEALTKGRASLFDDCLEGGRLDVEDCSQQVGLPQSRRRADMWSCVRVRRRKAVDEARAENARAHIQELSVDAEVQLVRRLKKRGVQPVFIVSHKAAAKLGSRR